MTEPSSRPNILFICSDQHTPRVTGCYGDDIVDTPHLDALAAEGARFDAFYCNNPICGPSRSSFFTGRYSYRAECVHNFHVLDSRLPTLAHVAVRGGYNPVLSGKMHFNGPDQTHGFLERLVGEMGASPILQGDPVRAPGLQNLGNCSRPDCMYHTGPGQNHEVPYDEDVTRTTVEWLHRWAEQEERPPFFFMAGYLQPHNPFIIQRELYDKYAGRVSAPRYPRAYLDGLHPHHRDYRKVIEIDQVPEENWDRAVPTYYGMVDQLDQQIGKLIAALKETGQWDNTIIIYTSDHGEMLGQHGRWHKECFREDSARVPLIVRDPRRPQPRVVSGTHTMVDLMPTLCEWTGVTPPPGLDGVSLEPALAGTETEAPPALCETYTHWTEDKHGMSSNRMVRQGAWKLCYYGAYDSYELFNLESDPEEMDNLAEKPEHAAKLEELKPMIFSGGWSRRIHDELIAKLNARGELDNNQGYRDALNQSLRKYPREIDYLGMWPGSRTTPTTLDADEDAPLEAVKVT
ncbi:MAG: sulfatase-like hydrolase/transferase [Verrucomicrobiota bacterium]